VWPCTEYFETFKPGALRPVRGATASLGGRNSTDYYGSADLSRGIGYLPAYPPRLEEADGISGFDSHSNLSADVGLLPTPWRGVPRLECVSIIVKILLTPWLMTRTTVSELRDRGISVYSPASFLHLSNRRRCIVGYRWSRIRK
jgi:hypothetical protein